MSELNETEPSLILGEPISFVRIRWVPSLVDVRTADRFETFVAEVEVSVSGIRAVGIVDLFAGDLVHFVDALRECDRILSGSAELASDDRSFVVDVHYLSLGHVRIQGKFRPDGSSRSAVEFDIATDSTFLSRSVAGISGAL